MPKPKNPDQVPRLRWSPEEMDLLIREVAMYLATAERNGKQITRNEALALAQHVLPKDRQREIGPDYNPRWMSNEGRLEAELEQARARMASGTVAAPAAADSLQASVPGQAPVKEQPMPKPPARTAPKSPRVGEPQSGLFSGPDPAPVPGPEPRAASAPLEGTTPAPALTDFAGEAAPQASPAPAGPPAPPAPAAAAAPGMTAQAPAAPAALEEALAAGALAGAFRSLVTKAVAGLVSDVLRQPEVRAALREAVASALSDRPAGADAVQPASRPGSASRTVQEDRQAARDLPRRDLASRTPRAQQAAGARPGATSPDPDSEPEIDDEPPPSDPYAWQPTPLEALPQRSARGASEPPKPSVLLFGLLPRDQQKLRADFADKYNLRFGSPHKARNLGEDLRKIDKVYALVRFIPKELDRSLSACGVPYGQMASVGELRQDLTINPPLSRTEVA